MSKDKQFFVYIVRCADGTLYTGWTTDIEKRILAHNSGPSGAKYTKARRPVVLCYQEGYESRSFAMKREAAIKKLSKDQKLFLIGNEKKTS